MASLVRKNVPLGDVVAVGHAHESGLSTFCVQRWGGGGGDATPFMELSIHLPRGGARAVGEMLLEIAAIEDGRLAAKAVAK